MVTLLEIKQAKLNQKLKELEIYSKYPADTEKVFEVTREIESLEKEIKILLS